MDGAFQLLPGSGHRLLDDDDDSIDGFDRLIGLLSIQAQQLKVLSANHQCNQSKLITRLLFRSRIRLEMGCSVQFKILKLKSIIALADRRSASELLLQSTLSALRAG